VPTALAPAAPPEAPGAALVPVRLPVVFVPAGLLPMVWVWAQPAASNAPVLTAATAQARKVVDR
jgi:hypothetical protein